jgi:purine-binding chemotaxis protein CheW
VLNFKEIIGMQEITHVPQMPPHIKCVINLRGRVIPVVDLSLKFSLIAKEYTHRTCIIILRTKSSSGERLIGAITDEVTEVLTIPQEAIEVSPDFGTGNPIPHLLGIARVQGKVKLLMDVNVAFSSEDIPRFVTS